MKKKITDASGKEIDTVKLHDVVINRIETHGKSKIEPVPPEESLIERRCKSMILLILFVTE